jgi:predicted metal-binding protein
LQTLDKQERIPVLISRLMLFKACQETTGMILCETRDHNMVDLNQLVEKAKELGAAAASAIHTSDIQFSDEFRTLCEQNSCGKYGTNWMCPPAIGTSEELKADVLKFSEGVVFQTVHKLEDSFDFEGMTKAGKVHDTTFRNILDHIHSNIGCEDVLALSVGDCKVCSQCTYLDGRECRYPDKAVASVEAYCIDVKALVTGCSIPYTNGPNTVSYVGLFLF